MKTTEEFKSAAKAKWMVLCAKIGGRLDQNLEEFTAWFAENIPREDSGQGVLGEILKLRGQLGCGPIFGTGDGLWGIMKTNGTTAAINAHHILPKLRDILREMVMPKPSTKEGVLTIIKQMRSDSSVSIHGEDLDIIERFIEELR